MKKIIDVIEFVSVPDRQFVVLSDDMVEYEDCEHKFITSVSRIKDAKIFVLDEVIYKKTSILNEIELTDEISITSFDGDMIHVELNCYRCSEDLKHRAGDNIVIKINDIENSMETLLRLTYEWFNEINPMFQNKI